MTTKLTKKELDEVHDVIEKFRIKASARVDYIVNYIGSQFAPIKSWIIDYSCEQQLTSGDICEMNANNEYLVSIDFGRKKITCPEIDLSNNDNDEYFITYGVENDSKLEVTIPGKWLFEDFEDEFSEALNSTVTKQKMTEEQMKQQAKTYKQKIASIKKKLTKEELEALGIY